MSASNYQRAMLNMRAMRREREFRRPPELSPVPFTPPRDRTERPPRREEPLPLQNPTRPTRHIIGPEGQGRPNEPYLVDEPRPRYENLPREQRRVYAEEDREIRVGYPGQALYREELDPSLNGMQSRKRRASSAEIDLINPRVGSMQTSSKFSTFLGSFFFSTIMTNVFSAISAAGQKVTAYVRGRLDGTIEHRIYDPQNDHVSIKRAKLDSEPKLETIENGKWINKESMDDLDAAQRRFVSGFAEILVPIQELLEQKDAETERPAFRAAMSTILEPLASILINHVGDQQDLQNGQIDLYGLWERLNETLIRGVGKVYDVRRWVRLRRSFGRFVPRRMIMDLDLPAPLNRLDLMHIRDYISTPELPQVLYNILGFCDLPKNIILDPLFADLLILDLSLILGHRTPAAYVDSKEYYLDARERNPDLHRWNPNKDIYGFTNAADKAEASSEPPEPPAPEVMPGEFPEDADMVNEGEVPPASPSSPTTPEPPTSPRPHIQRTRLQKRQYSQADINNIHWKIVRQTREWQRSRARRAICTQYIEDFTPKIPHDHRLPFPDLKSILRNRKRRMTPRRLRAMVGPKTVRFTDSTLSPRQRSHTGWELARRSDYEVIQQPDYSDGEASVFDRLDNVDDRLDAMDARPDNMGGASNRAMDEIPPMEIYSNTVVGGLDGTDGIFDTAIASGTDGNSYAMSGALDSTDDNPNTVTNVGESYTMSGTLDSTNDGLNTVADEPNTVDGLADSEQTSDSNHDETASSSEQTAPSSSESVIPEEAPLSMEEFKKRFFHRLTSYPPQPDAETGARLIDELFATPDIVSLQISDESKAAIALRKEQDALRAKEEARKADEEARRVKEAAQRAAEEAARQKLEARLAKSGGLRLPTQRLVGPLSPEWTKRARDTLRAANPTTLAVTGEGVDLRRHDFARVVPETEWLNDEIVNGSLNWLDKAINSAAGIKDVKTETRKCLSMSSFFWKQLKDRGFARTDRTLRRLGVDIKNFYDVDTILLPICENMHWTLLVIRPSKRTVAHMDSLNPRGSKMVTDMAINWFKFIWPNDFKEPEWKIVRHEAPRQTNGWDCGVHTITNAMCIALGVSPIDAYSAEDMPLQRLRIASMLLNQGFSGAFDLHEL